MDEQTLLTLLARFIKQSMAFISPPLSREVLDELAPQIADSAWNGLIVLMRQMLVDHGKVDLDEFGSFYREAAHWQFSPAASLLEANALREPRALGQRDLASHALFYLCEALKLMEAVEDDRFEVRSKLSEEQRLRATIYDQKGPSILANELHGLSKRLSRVATNLEHGHLSVNKLTSETESIPRVTAEDLQVVDLDVVDLTVEDTEPHSRERRREEERTKRQTREQSS